jgi:hypothetical protein
MNVINSISKVGEFTGLVTGIDAWLKKQTGDSRAVVSELKDNLIQINFVLEHEVDLADVIDEITMSEYKRLQLEGFNFNSIKKTRIKKLARLKGTDLEPWVGKTTESLIESIYDKINELKKMYPKLKNSPKFRPGVRLINIRKRISLLMEHLRS